MEGGWKETVVMPDEKQPMNAFFFSYVPEGRRKHCTACEKKTRF